MTTTPSTPAARADVTLAEVLEGANGFDEIAVAKHFDGLDLYVVDEAHPMRLPRAVVFLHRRTVGDTDAQAKEFAMTLRVGDVDGYFADDTEETDPDQPVSAVGEGGSPHESEPTS